MTSDSPPLAEGDWSAAVQVLIIVYIISNTHAVHVHIHLRIPINIHTDEWQPLLSLDPSYTSTPDPQRSITIRLTSAIIKYQQYSVWFSTDFEMRFFIYYGTAMCSATTMVVPHAVLFSAGSDPQGYSVVLVRSAKKIELFLQSLFLCLPSGNHIYPTYRRPRWLGRLSSCLLRSISRLQFSPSAHTRREFSLRKN